MIKTKMRSLLLASSVVLSMAAEATTVTPGGELVGNSNNCMSLYCNYTTYQQIFNASSFGGVSGIVNSIAFRLDEEINSASISGFTADYEVHLSHSNATAATLSSNLASNRGADDTIVLSGLHTYSATQLPGLGANPFDFVLDIDNAFFYNGTGSLLLEIVQRSIGPGPLLAFDARSDTNYTSRAFTGGAAGIGYGFVAQFDISPVSVPEPSTLVLFGLGLIGLGSATATFGLILSVL